jgi:hypothetical protein
VIFCEKNTSQQANDNIQKIKEMIPLKVEKKYCSADAVKRALIEFFFFDDPLQTVKNFGLIEKSFVELYETAREAHRQAAEDVSMEELLICDGQMIVYICVS